MVFGLFTLGLLFIVLEADFLLGLGVKKLASGKIISGSRVKSMYISLTFYSL